MRKHDLVEFAEMTRITRRAVDVPNYVVSALLPEGIFAGD